MSIIRMVESVCAAAFPEPVVSNIRDHWFDYTSCILEGLRQEIQLFSLVECADISEGHYRVCSGILLSGLRRLSDCTTLW